MAYVAGVEDEIERLDRIIIAAENWAERYSKTPEIHTKLIKSEAKLSRQVRGFFKSIAADASKLVNWNEYHQAVTAAVNVKVIVNDDELDSYSGEFVNVALDTVTLATALGAQSGEQLYKKPIGLTSASAVIQDRALNHVAGLVGMKVDKNGKLVPNPRAEMNILDTTRDNIRSSISRSIALGEDINKAIDRLSSIIDDPNRAEMIARTETVNSFGNGLHEFGVQTDAVGKEWEDVGADDECSDNTDAGPIAFDDTFPSGDDSPAAHPNCRCSMRLIYQNELDDNPDLLD